MDTKELQNNIIHKVLHTEDPQLLDYLYKLLNNNENQQIYQLSEFERTLISESQADYEKGNVISNEEFISKNEEWLKE